uniref:Uncharacterized protein n=1 Tax=Cucumis sativus TaxID=3659 RepID=A0A0A0KYY7_CUCSA
MNIGTKQDGCTAAEEVNSASLLLYQSSTLRTKLMPMAMALHHLFLSHGSNYKLGDGNGGAVL